MIKANSTLEKLHNFNCRLNPGDWGFVVESWYEISYYKMGLNLRSSTTIPYSLNWVLCTTLTPEEISYYKWVSICLVKKLHNNIPWLTKWTLHKFDTKWKFTNYKWVSIAWPIEILLHHNLLQVIPTMDNFAHNSSAWLNETKMLFGWWD
jgi:hypothetical protein